MSDSALLPLLERYLETEPLTAARFLEGVTPEEAADLFYRLSVVSLEIPPLRERKQDIPELVARYTEYFQSKFPTSVTSINRDALEALVDYAWPGNVRELVNVIERAMLLCPGEAIRLEDLPMVLREAPSPAARTRTTSLPPRGQLDTGPCFEPGCTARTFRELRVEWIDQLEERYLRALLLETGGRIDETARRAGLNPRNPFEKMRRHKLRKEDFRGDDRNR